MLSVLWFVFLDFTDTIINQGLIFKVLSPGPVLSLRVFSFTADLGGYGELLPYLENIGILINALGKWRTISEYISWQVCIFVHIIIIIYISLLYEHFFN